MYNQTKKDNVLSKILLLLLYYGEGEVRPVGLVRDQSFAALLSTWVQSLESPSIVKQFLLV